MGRVLWGIGTDALDSMLKAPVSRVISAQKRSTAFGVFDTGFGLAWFARSAAMGPLYGKSILAAVAFSTLLQVAALPFFWRAWARSKN